MRHHCGPVMDKEDVMKTITLHNIPDALHAAIEARARQHQRSVEDEMRHMLEQGMEPKPEEMPTPPVLRLSNGQEHPIRTLKDLCDAIPPEARLNADEVAFFNSLRKGVDTEALLLRLQQAEKQEEEFVHSPSGNLQHNTSSALRVPK